ncbi:hypothetical protein RIEGSTA812A_PEG_794 [invertebrate metagenome]|uniref:Uncharacterized protein n=1 Tax=invertebrate metagenome TaxID=1711999 RepID=A0A484H748_9ZZZZ
MEAQTWQSTASPFSNEMWITGLQTTEEELEIRSDLKELPEKPHKTFKLRRLL